MICLARCERLAEIMGLTTNCCTSCHEDVDMGYPMCERDDGNGNYVEFCCALLREMDGVPIPWDALLAQEP